MEFLRTLDAKPFMLYDGPMETRIKYNTDIPIDDTMSIFQLIYDEEGQHALRKLYEGDIATTEHYHAPIILNAPTFRASSHYLTQLGFNDADAVKKINADAIQFVKNIRDKFGAHKYNIYVTAPIGPRQYEKDAGFTVDKAEDYHSSQAMAIAESDVDIISIAAMPDTLETIGCAKAVAKAVAKKQMPYSVGVMISPEGKLLDGNTLENLITELDSSVTIKPNFYILSCTHPSNAKKALKNTNKHGRVLGIKANGSAKSAEELFAANHPLADAPDVFAEELIELGKEFNFKIYGGCCGTDVNHLAALARDLCKTYQCEH